jgi:hypothetical protein
VLGCRGTVNLFVLLDVHRPWRKVKVTERRAAKDYAQCMRDLVDVHYPRRRDHPGSPGLFIRRSQADLAAARVPLHPQARKLAQHVVEIEIGLLRGQCLDRRLDDPKRLRREIAAWEGKRNAARASNGCSQQTKPAPKWAAPSRYFQRVIITVQSH